MDDIWMICLFQPTQPPRHHTPSPGSPENGSPYRPNRRPPTPARPCRCARSTPWKIGKNHGTIMGRSWVFPWEKPWFQYINILSDGISWFHGDLPRGFAKGISWILSCKQVPAVDQGLSHPCWERGYSQEQKGMYGGNNGAGDWYMYINRYILYIYSIYNIYNYILYTIYIYSLMFYLECCFIKTGLTWVNRSLFTNQPVVCRTSMVKISDFGFVPLPDSGDRKQWDTMG